jgi:Asp-tRNA(Asn)/Glu-tRNA(Gln) amidotransferase A subunit family amidase
MHAINGGDPADPGSIDVPFGYEPDRPIAGLRVGYFPDDFGDRETDDLDRQVLELLPRLDLELVPLERPSLPYLSLRSIMFAEAAAAFETLTLNGRDDLLLRQDEDAWPNEFRKARFLSAVDYVQLDRFRRQVMEIMDGCFRQVDAVIGPSMVGPMLTITNYTGHPCVVVRSGFIQSASREPKRGSGTSVAAGPERLVPHGITLWGHLFQEDTILRIGRALERHLAVWNERPPACN